MELRTTGCYGTCPVFTISIYENRVVTLEAVEFLDLEGKFISRLSNNTFDDLLIEFQNSSFFDFQEQYTGPVSDLPTKYITYREGGKTKTITDYYGAPQELKYLEEKISQLIDQASWKKR